MPRLGGAPPTFMGYRRGSRRCAAKKLRQNQGDCCILLEVGLVNRSLTFPVTLGGKSQFVNPTSEGERRKRPRFPVRCQVRLLRGSSSGEFTDSVTQDISSMGFFCFSPSPFKVGETLTCRLKMPSQDFSNTQSPFTLEFLARVVRVENANEEGNFGIACQIEDYHPF